MNEDELHLSKQFGLAANAMASFFTNSKQLHRKAYNDGVNATISRIEQVLVQHKNSNHNAVPIDYLLNLLGGLGSELHREEKPKAPSTPSPITVEQPKSSQTPHITHTSFHNANVDVRPNNSFWEQNNTNERQTNHASVFRTSPTFTFGVETVEPKPNDYTPFSFSSDTFNFNSHPVDITNSNTTRRRRQRNQQETAPTPTIPHSNKRSHDTMMQEDIFFNEMNSLELGSHVSAPDTKRTRLCS